MSRIGFETKSLIERLTRLDPTRPPADRAAVERALSAHLGALGLQPRPIVWAPDPEAGHFLARSAALDTPYARAWVAVGDAAEVAIRAAARVVRRILISLFSIAVVFVAMPTLLPMSTTLAGLFAFGVMAFRPLVLGLSTLTVILWREWEDFGSLPGLADLIEAWSEDDEDDDHQTAAGIGFTVLLGVLPAVLATGEILALGLAVEVVAVGLLAVFWIRCVARITAIGFLFLFRPLLRRPPGGPIRHPFVAPAFAAVLLSVVLAGIISAVLMATPLGIGFAVAGGLAAWVLALTAIRALGPDAAAGPLPKPARMFEAVFFAAATGLVAAAMTSSPFAVAPVTMVALLGWLFLAAIGRRVAHLLHSWDADDADVDETTLRITWSIVVLFLGLAMFALTSGASDTLLLGIGLTFCGGACAWALARMARLIVTLVDVSGNSASEAAAVSATAAIGDHVLTAVHAIVQRRIRGSAHDAAAEAIQAIGEIGRAIKLPRPAIARRAATWRPMVEAYEAGLLLCWFTRGAVVCVLRPPLAMVNGRLHCPDGPAVRWPSGLAMWFWRGVEVPDWVIEEPRHLTVAVIRAERNQEVRRCLAEIYGLQRYLRDAGANLIHEDAYGKLWETQVGHELWRIVEVINGTPEPDGSRRTYTLDVTGAERLLGWPIETARAAVAATYGLRPEEYGPEVRT